MSVNVSDYLRDAAKRNPDGVAIEEPVSGRTITWRDFDSSADQFARALLGMGLVAGHRVGLSMANGIDFAVAWFGALRCGMVAVPMNPRSTPEELTRMISSAGPRVVVCDAASIGQLRLAGTSDTIVVVGGAAPRDGEVAFDSLLEGAADTDIASPLDAETAAAIMFTSGASGQPRGAILSHRALLANLEQVGSLERTAVSSDDRVLVLLPMFHIYGLNAILDQCVRVGATMVVVNRFEPDELLALVAERRLTNLPIAPPIVAEWAGRAGAKEALADVRIIVCGSAPLDPDLQCEFEQSTGHAIEQGYGLTEASPVVTTTLGRPDGTQVPPGSVGFAVPGVELQLRDHLGEPGAPGDPSQIWIRGDNLFSGYWPAGDGGPDEDGWYGTGDIGIVDSTGSITLVDRVRELIIVSGFNVYPSEVEDIIMGVPAVAQTAVVGVADQRTGEAVLAFVVPTDQAADPDVLSETVLKHCRERIARFKVPSTVVVVADLPRSATGKIEKGRLRALARGRELGL